MLGFHEKRKFSHIFYSKGTIFVLFVACILMAYAAVNAYERGQEARIKRTMLSDELVRLEARATDLGADIARLEDPRGVETELRQRYDVGKDGEEVIVFIEKKDTTAPAEETRPTPKTLLERIKGLFVGE